MTSEKKRSLVEKIKESSHLLRGEIAAELRNGTDHFGGDSVQLLKHHGTYQQDNRDERTAARAAGDQSKHHSFLLRTRVPGGKLTSGQLLAELQLAEELANGTLRITSRQGLQLHGVLKTHLQEVIQRINAVHLTTLGACGDVNRNVMCCPVPYASPVHDQLQSLALELARHFAPRTGAYHDIWLCDAQTGEKQLVDGGSSEPEQEPLYGEVYLPRKFKMGLALPHDNCIDIYTNDLGLLAIVEADGIIGYNILVGGGMGVTPSNKKTYPALAKKLAFVAPDQVIAVCEAVVKVQRDHGNRADRKIARMKYLVDRLGIDVFRARVEEYFGGPIADPHPVDVYDTTDHLGWEAQGDGRWYYGLNIENGRIADTPSQQLKTALREICRETRARHSSHGAPEHSVHRHRGTGSSQVGAHTWPPSCSAE